MLDAYEVLREEQIDDVHAHGTLLRHKKTGARVVLLSNVDFGNPNQSIYFRPVAWADAGNLDFKGVSAMPSAAYVLGVLAVLIVLLTLLCYLFIRKKNIEVMPQI